MWYASGRRGAPQNKTITNEEKICQFFDYLIEYDKEAIMREPRGNDILTTFLGGCVGIVVFGTLIIFTLALVFS